MATIKYELATKITNSNGKERWHKIGVVFENDKGPFAIIDNIPVGFTGMVSMFEPKEREQSSPVRSEKQSHVKSGDLEDSIPF